MKKFDLKDPEHQVELYKGLEGSEVELNKGLDRLGNTPAARLEWVIRLVQTNLDELSTGSRLDLAYEIYAFSLFAGLPSWVGLLPWGKNMLPSFDGLESEFLPKRSLKDIYPTLKNMKVFQALASKTLSGIANGNRSIIYRVSIERVFLFRDPLDKSEALAVMAINTRLEESFKLCLLMTLIAQGGRVRHCSACKRYFRASRRNQEYCSLPCQTRNATHTYREKHGLITGKPRGRPRKVEPKGKNQSKIKPSKTAKKGGSKRGTKTRKR